MNLSFATDRSGKGGSMRIGIFGRGRLGRAVTELAEREGDLELAWCIDKGEEPSGPADAVLDASAAEAVPGHVEWALSTRTDLVIGATGWDQAVLGRLAGGKPGIGIMVSPNFSLGVAFMRRAALALGRLAALDPGADLSIYERHHRAKADAPSGTAKLLARALAEGCPRYSGWALSAAEPGKVSVASLRSGADVGYHELRLEAVAETITLSHQALSRGIFAAGALRALRWIRGRDGLYTFDDLAAELIDPLFAPRAGTE
jgi:4-hydroxy-tetrahydrodipicolinate reductase